MMKGEALRETRLDANERERARKSGAAMQRLHQGAQDARMRTRFDWDESDVVAVRVVRRAGPSRSRIRV